MNGDKLLKIARENPDVAIDDGTHPAPSSKAKSSGRKRSSLEQQFAGTWSALDGPPLEDEYRFHPKRRWLLDFAHPAVVAAVRGGCAAGAGAGAGAVRGGNAGGMVRAGFSAHRR